MESIRLLLENATMSQLLFVAFWIGFAAIDGIPQLVILGSTSVVISILFYVTYGLPAGRLGRLIKTRRQAVLRNIFFANLFAGAGITMACTGRR